ncbi:hypothetical protein PSHT_13864 [Puccinia striiformis]|uniref:Uncharacterized protein n=1 Tax=Puccinia striiformis TaxID=27350 RepID=A0A2S4UN93_9BASI|nr:hypothetical protein PSHT_13864 [Puccinia striiformis]
MRVSKSFLTSILSISFLSRYHPVHASHLQPRWLNDAEFAGQVTIGTQGGQGMKEARRQEPTPKLTTAPNLPANIGFASGRRSSEPDTRPAYPGAPQETLALQKKPSRILAAFDGIKTSLTNYVSPWITLQDLQKAREMRTRLEKVEQMNKYREVRDQISEVLGQARPINYDHKKSWDDMAEEFERKLYLGRYVPDTRFGKGSRKSQLEDYLLKLQRRQFVINELQNFQNDLESIYISTDLSHAEKEVMQEVSNFIKAPYDRQSSHKFGSFHKDMVQSVKSHMRQWPDGTFSDLKQYFPKERRYNQFKDAINWDEFILARAVQLKKKPAPEVFDNHRILTVDEIIHKLPQGQITLETQMHHYAMIKRFEVLLQDLREAATSLLEDKLQDRRSELQERSDVQIQLRSIFASPTQENQTWLDEMFYRVHGTTPSRLFEQLSGPPGDQVQMRSALDSNAKSLAFLSSSQVELQDASYDRPTFEKTSEIERLVSRRRVHLEAVRKVRNDAISPDSSVDHRFIQELYNAAIIDHPTTSNLNSWRSREGLRKALGSQEDFRRNLMSTFETTLVNRLFTLWHGIGQPVAEEIVDDTVLLFARSHIDELDRNAREFYLTSDAFLKSNYGFNEAMGVYNPDGLVEFAGRALNPEMRVKAYVEAHFVTDLYNVKTEVEYSSLMDEFLSQIKIPQFGPNAKLPGALKEARRVFPKGSAEEIIATRLEHFDERLYSIYLEPLEVGDWRITGTPFERLTEESVRSLNTVVKTICSNRNRIRDLAQEQIRLTNEIEEYEELKISQNLQQ